MKKELSFILAVIMLLGCMSIPVYAENDPATSGSTAIKAVKSAAPVIEDDFVPVSYEMVIPTAVTLTQAGFVEIGTPSVKNVTDGSVNTIISYTVTGSQLKLENSEKIMPTSYYITSPSIGIANIAELPQNYEIKVYEKGDIIPELPTLHVGVTENDWFQAEAGTYAAFMTFNFTSTEAACKVPLREIVVYVYDISGDFITVAIYQFNSSGTFSSDSYVTKWPKAFASQFLGDGYKVGDYFHMSDEQSTKCTNPKSHNLPPVDSTWELVE